MIKWSSQGRYFPRLLKLCSTNVFSVLECKGWLCIHNWLRVIWAALLVRVLCACMCVCFFPPEVGNDGWRHQWDLAHHPSDHTTHLCETTQSVLVSYTYSYILGKLYMKPAYCIKILFFMHCDFYIQHIICFVITVKMHHNPLMVMLLKSVLNCKT